MVLSYDYDYRYYSPGLGRWVNRDQIEERKDTQLYLFCRSVAITSIDKYGHVAGNVTWVDHAGNLLGTYMDIPVEYVTSSSIKGALGRTTFEIDTKRVVPIIGRICKIRIISRIRVDDTLPVDNPSGTFAGYDEHDLVMTTGGIGNQFTREMVAIHEYGHASAEWDFLTSIEAALQSFIGSYSLDMIVDAARTTISKSAGYKSNTALGANNATECWFWIQPYPEIVPPMGLHDMELRRN
jgi:hypothetical protein